MGPELGEVIVDHDPYDLGEAHLGNPPELLFGLGRVPTEEIDLGRPCIPGVEFDVGLPVLDPCMMKGRWTNSSRLCVSPVAPT